MIPDDVMLMVDGFLLSCMPEELVLALEQRFLTTQRPQNLTLVHAAGQGDGKGRGIDHLAHPGLLRRSIGGHWNMIRGLQRLALENKIEAYNLPQGVITHMIRDSASCRPGTLTRTGVGTFIDPRIEGGKVNASTTEDLVKLVEIGAEEYLLYAPLPIKVALLRGTVADMHGNISMEEEAMLCSALSAAQAAHNHGGLVIVQVARTLENELLPPRSIHIPGIYVDVVVPVEDPEHHLQANGYPYDPALCGLAPRLAEENTDPEPPIPLDERKIIARRALKELRSGDIANLGIGVPEGIGLVAAEEGRLNDFILTVESGPIGGKPLSGLAFGCSRNYESLLDAAAQFDFYQGGGLDIAFLGLAQTDSEGNVNVSRFGSVIAGCGGFIDITQNARRVVFCGAFAAKGLQIACENGKLRILQEGQVKKFCSAVEQITFSGTYARKRNADVLFITERAVFRLMPEGLELIEYAPGVDIERDIIAMMDYAPIIRNPVPMDTKLFMP